MCYCVSVLKSVDKLASVTFVTDTFVFKSILIFFASSEKTKQKYDTRYTLLFISWTLSLHSCLSFVNVYTSMYFVLEMLLIVYFYGGCDMSMVCLKEFICIS